MSLIKRFKQIIEGDLSLFEEAVSTSPESFELNEAKTHLRCIKKVEEPKKEEEKDEKQSKNEEKIKNHIESLNHRSIYAKGFSVDKEPSEKDLKEFYGKFGRVLSLKFRREGDKKYEGKFKGSIFVEFENQEIAERAVAEATEYDGKELLTMIKGDYVDMKKREKYQGQEFEFKEMKKRHRYLVEYKNAKDTQFSDIKQIVKAITPVGRVEKLKEAGSGVLEIFETTPEEFLSKLGEQNAEGIQFMLCSAEARKHFLECQDKVKHRHDKGGRGGRGFRGKKRPQGRQQDDSNKRPRGVVEVKTAEK
ncbi:hypothetical protein RMATCC62417_10235 [Rhizopus microsporus]|nr:hypothetical protein RMATCC62417_10235 [Rhizopus microsporus]